MTLPYLLGLDLGQTSDPSAMVALQLERIPDPLHQPPDAATLRRGGRIGPEMVLSYLCRLIHRWPLGTPYTRIVNDVVDLTSRPPLERAILVVDQTGVGRAVVDQFRATRIGRNLIAVTITAGTTASVHGREYHVPKKDLVGVLQTALQQRRWKVSAKLPEAEVLTKELHNFQVKITTAANETFGTWREGNNDDTVLASAVAIWYAERSNLAVRRRPPRWTGGVKIPRIDERGMREG